MSVTMTRADGVTVFTLTSDPKSPWPPLCQIIKALCYSPACCTVSQHLSRVQRTSLPVLGTLQIMVGLLNIGLGAILCSSGYGSSYTMDETKFPFWLGGLFLLFGIMCILSQKRASPCLVILNVILNLAGVAFAITAIVLYSINMGTIYMWFACKRDEDYNWYDRRQTTPDPSPEVIFMQEKCLEGKALVLMLIQSINAVLIVLSVLELCVTISAAVLGIKALRSSEKGEDESTGDPECYKPLLE
ncbi:high affinity immunoglobulin epsilon receptor subunit beta-like [Mastacembelus armatus]|uniref:High affinity immunoglobulin epsilon receptor subunit beta-like n=1 Tax=Mastacembelus armatus TaxID=205130 RepID=A0A3Q3M1Y1_9TELE|nr:high affinity immunoglobulin epsilon receptor subunit beta-like [Mastacembelus armatus]